MPKLTQIERAIRGLGPAVFQQLCDAYVHRKGYEAINPLGRVPGRDQVAPGTPDTWIPEADGRFVFAEYTTQESGLLAKIRSDFAKCMDEAKTGVPRSRIREVVFCHSQVLEPADHLSLIELAQEFGVVITVFGLGNLAHDLYQKYPVLARDFLGIEVDTGQILTQEDFVAAYGHNALATPLDTDFQFRDEEAGNVADALRTQRIVIVTGPPGTGKTRLALEALRLISVAEPTVAIRCILSKGTDLFEDTRTHFAEPGDYVVLVDDANRVGGFEHVLQLLDESRSDRTVRVLATVRDYAREKVHRTVQQYGGSTEIRVGALTNDQIQQLVERTTDIRNGFYLRRIAEIAGGNPRLAMMAARVARAHGTLESIRDASELYHLYYAGIRRDLDDLADPLLVRTAGIVVFLRVVDRENTEQMEQISTAFGISAEAFWQAAGQLHGIELLDMHENEVVKVSDQVLGTYLLFVAAFETGGIDLSRLLKHYFPGHRHRIVDALNGVIRAFGSEQTFDRLRASVDQVWQEWASSDKGRLRELMHTFWFVRPTETLLYVHHQIAELATEPRSELVLDYANAPGEDGPSLVGLLGAFSHASPEEIKIALGLLLDYAAKRASDLPRVLRTLVQSFGYQAESYLEGYQREQLVLDTLQERLSSTGDPLYADVVSVVAGAFLETEVQRIGSGTGRSISITRFTLQEVPTLRELRTKALSMISQLYTAGFRDAALRVLESYAASGRWLSPKEIAAKDADQLLSVVVELDSTQVRECMVVNDYLNELDRLEIPYDLDLRTRFSALESELSNLLLVERLAGTEMSWQEQNEFHHEKIRSYFQALSEDGWAKTIEGAQTLRELRSNDHARFQISHGIAVALAELAQECSSKFLRVLEHYLHSGDTLRLPDWQIVRSLLLISHPEQTLEFLRTHVFPSQNRWISTFFAAVPEAGITSHLAEEVLAHFRLCTAWELPHDLEFLDAYRHTHPSILVDAVRIIVGKAHVDVDAAHPLESLFNSFGSLLATLPARFADEVILVEEAYMLASAKNAHMDYDGSAFALLAELDADFPVKYLESLLELDSEHSSRGWSRHERSSDYKRFATLWRRDDYDRLMERLIDRAFESEKEDFYFHGVLQILLSLPDAEESSAELINQQQSFAPRQDVFLTTLIQEHAGDRDFLEWLFDGVTNLPEDRKRALVTAYLSTHPTVDDFKRIPLEPRFSMASGSWIPIYQRRVDFLESLLPLFDTVELLPHRACIAEQIASYRERIRQQKRDDFFED